MNLVKVNWLRSVSMACLFANPAIAGHSVPCVHQANSSLKFNCEAKICSGVTTLIPSPYADYSNSHPFICVNGVHYTTAQLPAGLFYNYSEDGLRLGGARSSEKARYTIGYFVWKMDIVLTPVYPFPFPVKPGLECPGHSNDSYSARYSFGFLPDLMEQPGQIIDVSAYKNPNIKADKMMTLRSNYTDESKSLTIEQITGPDDCFSFDKAVYINAEQGIRTLRAHLTSTLGEHILVLIDSRQGPISIHEPLIVPKGETVTMVSITTAFRTGSGSATLNDTTYDDELSTLSNTEQNYGSGRSVLAAEEDQTAATLVAEGNGFAGKNIIQCHGSECYLFGIRVRDHTTAAPRAVFSAKDGKGFLRNCELLAQIQDETLAASGDKNSVIYKGNLFGGNAENLCQQECSYVICGNQPPCIPDSPGCPAISSDLERTLTCENFSPSIASTQISHTIQTTMATYHSQPEQTNNQYSSAAAILPLSHWSLLILPSLYFTPR